MTYEKEIRAAVAFLDPARTAIDEAELKLIAAIGNARPGPPIFAAVNGMLVAVRNLQFCVDEVRKIAEKMTEDQNSATAAVRPTAG